MKCYRFTSLTIAIASIILGGCWRSDKETLASKEQVKIATQKLPSKEIELKIGQNYYISSPSGQFLGFSSQDGFLFSNKGHDQTFFEVESTSDNKIFLKSEHGTYLSAQDDNTVTSVKKPQAWEAFSIISVEGKRFVLKTYHGTILHVSKDGRTLVHSASPINEDRVLTFSEVYDSNLYRQVIINAKAPTDKERVVWTFSDRGQDSLSDFHKLNIEGWRRILGASWTVRVLNAKKEGQKLYDDHILNFVSAADLPGKFDKLEAQARIDAVRLAILKKFGGVWLDPSTILLKNLDEFCWNELSNQHTNTLLVGLYNSAHGSDHLKKMDFIETPLLAVRRNNAFIKLWHSTFISYWENRSKSTAIWESPLFNRLDLSNFTRYEDHRNLLTSHVAFRKIIEENFIMRTIWEHNMLLKDAKNRAHLVPTKLAWDPQIVHKKLVDELDEEMLDQLFSESWIMAFSGILSAPFETMTTDELLNSNGTLSQVYQRIFSK